MHLPIAAMSYECMLTLIYTYIPERIFVCVAVNIYKSQQLLSAAAIVVVRNSFTGRGQLNSGRAFFLQPRAKMIFALNLR